MAFERIGIRPAQILLPAPGVKPETWACIACDQYTSEPEYWQKAFAAAGDAPSAIRLILPEYDLKNSETLIPRIHQAMADYLAKGLLAPALDPGFILCERTIASGTRLGLVCAVDLEEYSFEKGSLPLIRPTEQTITDRLPPRLKIRRGAPVELTHIMILIDDPDRTVLEPLQAAKASLRKVYDFDLMMGGGHLAGWAVEGKEMLARVDQSLNALMDTKGEHPLLLAVGDGNHSLATAKAYWNDSGTGEPSRPLRPVRNRKYPRRSAALRADLPHRHRHQPHGDYGRLETVCRAARHASGPGRRGPLLYRGFRGRGRHRRREGSGRRDPLRDNPEVPGRFPGESSRHRDRLHPRGSLPPDAGGKARDRRVPSAGDRQAFVL